MGACGVVAFVCAIHNKVIDGVIEGWEPLVLKQRSFESCERSLCCCSVEALSAVNVGANGVEVVAFNVGA